MENSERSLEQGRAMSAEGYGKNASVELDAAAGALREQQEAREQLRDEAQQMREGNTGQQPDNGSSSGTRAAELPAPEEFRTPEEYRRALLEGMEGEVPEEYRAMKRRYYEELVLQ